MPKQLWLQKKTTLQTKKFIMNAYCVLYFLMNYSQGNAPHSGLSGICSWDPISTSSLGSSVLGEGV